LNALASPIVGGATTFAALAAPIDYDADGRRDLLIPMPPGALPYDGVSRSESTTLDIAGASLIVRFGYDTDGRLASITYPSSGGTAPRTVERRYDAHGHLVAVGSKSATKDYWRFTETDAVGRIRQETFGNDAVTTRSYYDDRERVKGIVTTAGPT